VGSTANKASGLASEAVGKAKQGIGNVVGSDRLKTEGAASCSEATAGWRLRGGPPCCAVSTNSCSASAYHSVWAIKTADAQELSPRLRGLTKRTWARRGVGEEDRRPVSPRAVSNPTS
jgi:hypothetical protein